MSCTCQKCHKKYKTDIIVPDNLWLKIAPKGDESGLLCGSCIAMAIENLDSYDCWHLTKDTRQEELKIINSWHRQHTLFQPTNRLN